MEYLRQTVEIGRDWKKLKHRMSSQIVSVFTTYQKARATFAQQIADLATRPQNVEFLHNAGILKLLKPLLNDQVSGIQQTAAMALARLASFNEVIAEEIVKEGIIPLLVDTITHPLPESDGGTNQGGIKFVTSAGGSVSSHCASRHLKKAAAFVLRAIAKHSASLSREIISAGALVALNACLEEFDPGVKESAAWALGYLASHVSAPDLALGLIESGTVSLLVMCIQEPEIALKKVSISALSDIAKHSTDTAQAVVDANAVNLVAKLLVHSDARIRRQAGTFLSQIAKHTVDLAEIVVDAEVLTNLMVLLQDDDLVVRKNAAAVLREISKHSVELARLVVNSGGIQALVDLISSTSTPSVSSSHLDLPKGTNSTAGIKLPAVICLGYISAFSETLAAAVIASKGIECLKPLLGHAGVTEGSSSMNSLSVSHLQNDHLSHPHASSGTRSRASTGYTTLLLQAATVWTLGMIGGHTTEHAFACAENDVLRILFIIHSTHLADIRKDSGNGQTENEGKESNAKELAGASPLEYSNTSISFDETIIEDLKTKARKALKSILQKCTHMPALQSLLTLNNQPWNEAENVQGNKKHKAKQGFQMSAKLIKIVLHQIAKVLPNDKAGKKSFVQSGCLQFVQELEHKLNEKDFLQVQELVSSINNCFPSQLVDYYSPKHANELIKLIDEDEDNEELEEKQEPGEEQKTETSEAKATT